MSLTISLATLNDADDLACLFDLYRQFYQQAADHDCARSFITQRLKQKDSDLLIARTHSGAAAGFIQLFPTFCSIEAKPIAILNDLYVREDARRSGAASQLMDAAQKLGKERNWAYLLLSTAHTNTRAQALYEKKGWQLDTVYRYFTLPL